VYAIGAVMYHMLTGQAPPARDGDKPPLRPSLLRPEIPAALDDLVVRAGQADPERRWPSAADLAEALRGLREADPPSPRRSRRAWVAAVAAVALLLVGAATGGVLLLRAHAGYRACERFDRWSVGCCTRRLGRPATGRRVGSRGARSTRRPRTRARRLAQLVGLVRPARCSAGCVRRCEPLPGRRRGDPRPAPASRLRQGGRPYRDGGRSRGAGASLGQLLRHGDRVRRGGTLRARTARGSGCTYRYGRSTPRTAPMRSWAACGSPIRWRRRPPVPATDGLRWARWVTPLLR